jgi:hypothetical protein
MIDVPMGANVVLRQHDNAVGEQGLAWTRDEILARYRRLREISKRHNSEMLRFVSGDAMLHEARRLGLAQGRTLTLDDIDEMTFVYDLAIHTASMGRTRAIDRYARAANLAPGSDDAVVLEAMRNARFSIFQVVRRHETAGLILRDPLRKTDVWLVDQGLEKTAPQGGVIATRIYTPDRFSVTAGVQAPLDLELLEDALAEVPYLRRKPLAQVADDRRFAEAVYRVALADGVLERIAFADPLPETG